MRRPRAWFLYMHYNLAFNLRFVQAKIREDTKEGSYKLLSTLTCISFLN